MDSNIARWAQIVFWDQDDINDLHRIERELGTRSGPDRRPLFDQKKLPTWVGHSMMMRVKDRMWPNGYWPAGMAEPERGASIVRFTREIYPIWRGIERKAIEADKVMTHEQVISVAVMFEVTTLHDQDNAIRDSGIRPNTIAMTTESGKDFRRKAAASEKYGWNR